MTNRAGTARFIGPASATSQANNTHVQSKRVRARRILHYSAHSRLKLYHATMILFFIMLHPSMQCKARHFCRWSHELLGPGYLVSCHRQFVMRNIVPDFSARIIVVRRCWGCRHTCGSPTSFSSSSSSISSLRRVGFPYLVHIYFHTVKMG